MPFLRFSRDKRGYENTFVIHTGPAPRRGKPRTRILYWFRTPPGVRVGRSALDEDAIRLIEEHNPDLDFDWTRILKGGEAPPEQRPAPQAERRARPRPRDAAPPAPVAPRRIELVPSREAVETAPATQDPAVAFSEALPEPPVEIRPEAALPPPDGPVTAAQARLGSEGLSRLRARHAEVLARISEKVADPARRDELKSEAERLNPDTWVTDAEVAAGLEAYESVFESLRGVVGRRRKRRRRDGAESGQAPAGGASEDASTPAGTADAPEGPDTPPGPDEET